MLSFENDSFLKIALIIYKAVNSKKISAYFCSEKSHIHIQYAKRFLRLKALKFRENDCTNFTRI